MAEYYGPCDNMRNMTEFVLPMPESAIAMSEDRFIYHDFDKIRTRQYAILYWIIDTSNYKISNISKVLTTSPSTHTNWNILQQNWNLYSVFSTTNTKAGNRSFGMTTISLTVKGHTDIIDSRSSEL
nr:unnamed protein product [Spirometra erinaceieuropaei]